MTELNHDWVLMGSIATVIVTALVVTAWAWKTFKSME